MIDATATRSTEAAERNRRRAERWKRAATVSFVALSPDGRLGECNLSSAVVSQLIKHVAPRHPQMGLVAAVWLQNFASCREINYIGEGIGGDDHPPLAVSAPDASALLNWVRDYVMRGGSQYVVTAWVALAGDASWDATAFGEAVRPDFDRALAFCAGYRDQAVDVSVVYRRSPERRRPPRRKRLSKRELVAFLVDLADRGETASLRERRRPPTWLCVASEADRVARAAALVAQLLKDFTYPETPEFARLLAGRSAAYQAMRRRLEADPAKEVRHLHQFREALSGLLDSDAAFSLVPDARHHQLRELRDIVGGLGNDGGTAQQLEAPAERRG